MKPRLNIYLDDHIAAQIALLSKRPGLNKSRIVNDALDRFFNPEKQEAASKALIRRLDRMSKALDRLDRNQSINVETLALYIRYFLTITPPLPQEDQAAAHAIGKQRFEVFVAQIGRRLAQDKNLMKEVLATITDNRPDLFSADMSAIDKGPAKQDPAPVDTRQDDLPPLMPVHITDEDDPDAVSNSEDLEGIDGDIDDLIFDEEREDDHVT